MPIRWRRWHLNEPPEEKRTIRPQIRTELENAARSIDTVSALRAYADRFPSPHAGGILLGALDFFEEYKGRDKKKIAEHIRLGFGPRLSDGWSFLNHYAYKERFGPNLIIGISMWMEKKWEFSMRELERLGHKKAYGVEDPRDLVWEFLFMLSRFHNTKFNS
jgi:hypothetical protein